MFRDGHVHPGLSADAAYNMCHAISQVTHQVVYDACDLLGHAPTTSCSLGCAMRHFVADAVSLTPVAF